LLDSSPRHALRRLIGIVRSPRVTLTDAIRDPRSLDLAVAIIVISVVCSVGFLMTRTGRLAALDQQVRQLESFGAAVTDDTYQDLRAFVPYRPIVSAALIVLGWPAFWLAFSRAIQWLARRMGMRDVTFRQVLTVIVHASSIFAVRAVVAAPISYARESLGGATSLRTILPALGESTFPARLAGAVDLFFLWWIVLVALGLSILYQTRTMPIARWLFGAYAGGAAAVALTQAFRGGV
jgi:hypothetical protein